jgi:hypothetical protein
MSCKRTRRFVLKSLLTTLTVVALLIGGTSAEAKSKEAKVYGYKVSTLSDAKVGDSKRELRAQMKYSHNVLAFFRIGKGAKMAVFCHPQIALWHGPCGLVQGQKKAHRWLLGLASGRLKSIRAAERRAAELARIAREKARLAALQPSWPEIQMHYASLIAQSSGGDPWPNCPDPYDGRGSWSDTVNCENQGNWYDSPGYYRCGLQFDPGWEVKYHRKFCP